MQDHGVWACVGGAGFRRVSVCQSGMQGNQMLPSESNMPQVWRSVDGYFCAATGWAEDLHEVSTPRPNTLAHAKREPFNKENATGWREVGKTNKVIEVRRKLGKLKKC